MMMFMEQLDELLYGPNKNISERRIYLQALVKNQTNKTFESDLAQRHSALETSIIILAYTIICIISIFGNSLVCYVIFKNRRLYTAINFFLANLAVSDLLVTCINIPFNIARNLLDEWPFGEILCRLVNISLIVSVYVSTYTLTIIALDRHRVVVAPFTSKMSKTVSLIILMTIWLFAVCLALPYGIYNTVDEITVFVTTVKRCHSNYPSDTFEQYLTISTIILQYFTPLTVMGIAYSRIVYRLWIRTHVGVVTIYQQMSQDKAKRKSIKLLISVVIVFAICWLPINLYHVLTDFHPNVQIFQYNSRVFFICHWVAVSSTCFNPFVYCWLNDSFRQEVTSISQWCHQAFSKVNLFSQFGLFLRCKRHRRGSMHSTTGSSLASCARSMNTIKTSNSTDHDDILQIVSHCDANKISGTTNTKEGTHLLPDTEFILIKALINDYGPVEMLNSNSSV